MLSLSLDKETAIDAPQEDRSSSHTKRFVRIENANRFEALKFEGASLSIIEVLANSDAGSSISHLLMQGEDTQTPRLLELQLSTISLNKTEYRVATFCDVTESKKTARAEAEKRTIEFLTSNITHETITPLKCIINFSQSLQNVLKHSDARREAEFIYVTAKLILSQVKMLLDRNMLANDLFTLSNEDVPINRIVEDAVQIMKAIASVKSIAINLKFLQDETIVNVDPTRLQQVIINLISNAIKFSPNGSTIEVLVARSIKKTEYKYILSVTDHGIGISEEEQKSLFTPFFQSSSDTSQKMNSGGHGLGLSICKLLAERLNGEIMVQSEEG